jgi:hypothetical protein
MVVRPFLARDIRDGRFSGPKQLAARLLVRDAKVIIARFGAAASINRWCLKCALMVVR